MAPPTPTTALHTEALVKTYRGGRGKPRVTALDGLGFTVEPGTVFGLLGPNGAGKSTTVKILATLATADSGTATVAGYDVARHPDKVRRAIGLVAQRSVSDPMDTGRENLVLAGRLQGLSGRDAKARAERAARAVRARRRGEPPGRHLLRRDGPQARCRHRADAPPAGALPRRADHRARPGGPCPDVGGDRAASPATSR